MTYAPVPVSRRTSSDVQPEPCERCGRLLPHPVLCGGLRPHLHHHLLVPHRRQHRVSEAVWSSSFGDAIGTVCAVMVMRTLSLVISFRTLNLVISFIIAFNIIVTTNQCDVVCDGVVVLCYVVCGVMLCDVVCVCGVVLCDVVCGGVMLCDVVCVCGVVLCDVVCCGV